jgi:hypothetical protein
LLDDDKIYEDAAAVKALFGEWRRLAGEWRRGLQTAGELRT